MDSLLERKLKARIDADEKMLAAKQADECEWKKVDTEPRYVIFDTTIFDEERR